MIVGKALAQTWPTSLPLPLVSSFSAAALQVCAVVAPNLARALLVSNVPKDWRAQLDASKRIPSTVYPVDCAKERQKKS